MLGEVPVILIVVFALAKECNYWVGMYVRMPAHERPRAVMPSFVIGLGYLGILDSLARLGFLVIAAVSMGLAWAFVLWAAAFVLSLILHAGVLLAGRAGARLAARRFHPVTTIGGASFILLPLLDILLFVLYLRG